MRSGARSLSFLMPAKTIFVPLMNFFGFASHLSIVSSSHVTPLPATAPLKAKPDAVPAARPKTPCRFGPCLCAPPASIVWHWLHLRAFGD